MVAGPTIISALSRTTRTPKSPGAARNPNYHESAARPRDFKQQQTCRMRPCNTTLSLQQHQPTKNTFWTFSVKKGLTASWVEGVPTLSRQTASAATLYKRRSHTSASLSDARRSPEPQSLTLLNSLYCLSPKPMSFGFAASRFVSD